ncbi:hypothetical protein MIS45_04645 [Wielerella bovis]|uniref:XAC2610-related protein n=1 Tax=Wielerella bovis TaxID=2917790 RepID=UPI00201960DB|nr:hypothetical protein [Wielerella bovis]ULJ70115.1 hypothetical protein MIS45_04645 [Wielerella bovis]
MKKIIPFVLLFSILPIHARTNTATPNSPILEPMKLERGVTVERDLISKDGRYLFWVNTGTWRVNGIMLNRANNHQLNFIGTQKGYNLTLKSPSNAQQADEFIFTGTLNLPNNRIDGVLTTPNKQQAITFEPYIPIKNRPQFQFKFFGVTDPNASYIRTIKQIQVISQGKVVQTLSGFEARDYEAIYADYNFDGYFDLRLDIGEQATLDSCHQYWLYNPTSGKFVRDELLSSMTGSPSRYPEKNILRFNNTLLEMRNGKWYDLPCCAALN